jgi:DNA-binding response OmpR family regulator
MFVAPQALFGKRVLIVEDELIMAMLIEDFLLECGCIPIGPHSNVATALGGVLMEMPDLAVLDVNLAGEMVYPVAHALDRLSIPFLLMSGYGEDAAPAEFSHWRVCAKPFTGEDLVARLAALIDDAALLPPEAATV